jgi:hypothetical protein
MSFSPTSLPRARRALPLAFAAVLAVATSGCLGGSGSSGTPVTTGSLMVSASVSSSGATSCTDNTTFTYTPVAVSGTDGTGTVVTNHHNTTVFATQGRCPISDVALNLRLGTWRVNWSVTGSSCSADIHVKRFVEFDQNLNCKP